MENNQNFLEDIYYKNENGKGYRSIGEWIIIKSLTSFDPSHYNFNEHQVKHLGKVLETYGYGVIMKEAYSDKYRMHDPYSFTSWFLANIYGELVYTNYSEIDEKIKDIYKIANEILNKRFLTETQK